MRRLNKTTPFVLILMVFILIPGSIAQEEGLLYEGDDVVLQAWNSQPKYHFIASSSFQVVDDNRMWRFDTFVGQVEEPILWEYNWEEDIPEEYDQFIDELNENGMVVDYMLHFWDKAGHENGIELTTPRFQTDEQIQDFLNYTRFVVNHFQGRVQYYTIWSEPDACPGIKCIEPEDYVELVRRTVPIIREEDHEAKVAIAPNVLFFAQDYLSTVIESDIMTMVDVVQWHGIYNVLPDDSFFGDYYYQYPTIVKEIRQTAATHGFDGEYWATEITYC
jgi:hypothetical protein